ncbi:MAG TPA: haloacid dehalogenase-like hydrolase [Terriglobales bacterium]|nr:haloacid dehalogenase-like hydrolase [Terriglobales bacterium]
MNNKAHKTFLFASDFDQTLSFNDSGYVLSELVGIPVEEFERKAAGMSRLNLVQQGGELSYLLLHDPDFRSRVRREHLYEAGRRVRLKASIDLLYRILSEGFDGLAFDFYVVSAAPVEVIHSALEGIIPADHIYGTEFRYHASGEIDTIVQVTGGYGKVAVLDRLQARLEIGSDRIIYVGDGNSDIHVMLHVNRRDGFTIAVSENRHIESIATRTVLSDNALAILIPILEDLAGWKRPQIRALLEAHGFVIQEWEKVQTDWLTIRAMGQVAAPSAESLAEASTV